MPNRGREGQIPPEGTEPPVTVFADFTSVESCLTEAAVRDTAAERGLPVRYRAVELSPAPEPPARPLSEAEWEERVRPLADAAGIPMRRPQIVPRTRKAHEASVFAREHGVEDAMRQAIYRAFWWEGRDIGRIDVLQDLAPGIGLDAEDLKIALDIDRFTAEVEEDQRLAGRLRIRVLPAVYVGTGREARILIGVQTRADFHRALAPGSEG